MGGKTKRNQLRALARRQRGLDVKREIIIHAVDEPGGVWLHTHGLVRHGLPELELRDIPTGLMTPAGRLLNEVADYVLNSGKEVRPGERMEVDGYGMVQFQTAEPHDPVADHYDHPRYTLVTVPPGPCLCPTCAANLRRPTPMVH